ncbi:MAG: hypothetical protein ACRELY_32980 [Polyangiaceae bacterium]
MPAFSKDAHCVLANETIRARNDDARIPLDWVVHPVEDLIVGHGSSCRVVIFWRCPALVTAALIGCATENGSYWSRFERRAVSASASHQEKNVPVT